DQSTPVISTPSLHDALPICNIFIPADKMTWQKLIFYNFHNISPEIKFILTQKKHLKIKVRFLYSIISGSSVSVSVNTTKPIITRSEEHTSELQSRFDLVCRL